MKKRKGQLAYSAINYSIEHNYRKSYTDNEVFHDEKNEHLNNYKTAISLRQEWTNKALASYKARTRQNSQIKSDEMHYSYVINCTKDTIPQEIYESVGKFIEQELGSKIYDISIHKDEGSLIDKQTGRILMSGVDFFYNHKNSAYYSDKKRQMMIAKDFYELCQKYEIKKNYHAHIEFSAMRADGTSLKQYNAIDGALSRKRLRNGESKYLSRDEMTNYRIDKHFLTTINSRFIKLLNDDLVKNGKEKAIDYDENKDKDRPATKRIKGYKYQASLQERKNFGEKLSKKEERQLKKYNDLSGKTAVRLYDELKNTKSAIIRYFKDTLQPYYNEKFNFLEQSGQINADFLDYLQDERKNFFVELANFTKNYEIKELGSAKFLDDLKMFETKFEGIKNEFIMSLADDLKNQNAVFKQNLSDLSVENQILIIFQGKEFKIDLNSTETQNLAQSYTSALNESYEVIIDDEKPINERKNELNRFESLANYAKEKFESVYNAISKAIWATQLLDIVEFIKHFKGKLNNNPHRPQQ